MELISLFSVRLYHRRAGQSAPIKHADLFKWTLHIKTAADCMRQVSAYGDAAAALGQRQRKVYCDLYSFHHLSAPAVSAQE